MEFQRPANFKVSLSKTMEMMSIKDDVLKKNPKQYLKAEMLKLQVLSFQDPVHTEKLYQVSRGKNVHATFEKLKKEVMDIHFVNTFQPRSQLTPVVSYECTTNNSHSEIKFVTRKDNHKPVNVHFILKQQPKSCVFPNAPRSSFIRLKVGRKLPASAKLKESFIQCMNSGGLLFDFITDSLWPAIIKAENQEKEDRLKKKNESEKEVSAAKTNHRLASRSFSGSDRGPFRSQQNRSGNRRDAKQMNDGRLDIQRGARIPRHNQPIIHSGGQRSSYTDRGQKPSYPDRGQKSSYTDRGQKPSYPDRGQKPSYQDRSQKPSYQDRSHELSYTDRGQKPSYPDSGQKPSYQDRSQKPSFPDSGPKSFYPDISSKSSYPNRSPKPSYPDMSSMLSYSDKSQKPSCPDRSLTPSYPEKTVENSGGFQNSTSNNASPMKVGGSFGNSRKEHPIIQLLLVDGPQHQTHPKKRRQSSSRRGGRGGGKTEGGARDSDKKNWRFKKDTQ